MSKSLRLLPLCIISQKFLSIVISFLLTIPDHGCHVTIFSGFYTPGCVIASRH